MWKIVLVLLVTTAVMMMARLVYDPPVIQTRAGAVVPMETTYAYAGIRG